MGHVTAEDGSFDVSEVPPGTHTVVPMKDGVAVTEAVSVEVRPRESTRVQFRSPE
jgi:hypothetical protein